MVSLILAVILLILALGGIVVRRTYYALPVAELKRRAARGEEPAASMYKVVAYGGSLRGLLWLYIGLTSAGSLVLLARQLPVWVSLLVVGPLLWIAFSLLPASRVGRLGARLSIIVTPPLFWLLNYLHPALSRGTRAVEKRYLRGQHTGLFEREDLLRLIEKQQEQADSRLTTEELEIIRRALGFSEQTVGDVLISRKAVRTVQADATIGPILINELHQSGQPYVLVRDGAKGPFVGTLAFVDLDLQSTGQVRDAMDGTVYYLHADDSLSEALHAFFSTNHPLFVVVNSFEEYLGIITVETILRQLLGHIPGDDFDQYADRAAVAARHLKAEEQA